MTGYEEDVSFIRDRFTTWVKADPDTTLERHVFDVREALAEYGEASARRGTTHLLKSNTSTAVYQTILLFEKG